MLSIQRQLRLNRGQPTDSSACPAGSVSLNLEPKIRLVPNRPPWQTQARFRSRRPDSSEHASKPLPPTAAFRRIAVSHFPLSSNRLPYSPIFLAVRSDGRIHRPLGQFPRFAEMTSISLGVGCERQSHVLFGLARKPSLLFRHRGGVPPEKGKGIESIVEYGII